MRRIFFIATILVLSSQMIWGQHPPREKVQALKVAIFTEELSLTAKEAEKFWPLFNDYEKKSRAISKKAKNHDKANIEGKSDKEIEKVIEQRFKLKEQKLKLERDYYKKFKKVLPIKKVAKIPTAQRRFKLAVMKKSREFRKHRRKKDN